MTIILFVAFIIFVINTVSNSAKGKTMPTFQPAKNAMVKTLEKSNQPSMNLFRRIHLALYGDKTLVAELCRCDGDLIKHRTYIRVQWINSTTCNAEDGLPHNQFLMVLEDGKRLSLPIIEDEDGKLWVTYQGQRYNRWDSAVQVRRGLLEVLRGAGCKTKPAPAWREPVVS